MTPKEKAEELVKNFRHYSALQLGYMGHMSNKDTAKQCALIAVDEILKAPFENSYIDLIPNEAEDTSWFWDKFIEYWQQVKQEIENI